MFLSRKTWKPREQQKRAKRKLKRVGVRLKPWPESQVLYNTVCACTCDDLQIQELIVNVNAMDATSGQVENLRY